MAQTLTTPTSKASGSSLPLLRMDQKVLERLTNQQRQVLAGLVDGKSTQRIATDLGIPPNVARTEVARIQEILRNYLDHRLRKLAIGTRI